MVVNKNYGEIAYQLKRAKLKSLSASYKKSKIIVIQCIKKKNIVCLICCY